MVSPKKTRAWLDTQPAGRFDFTFTPKHGSWLNLIEGFFSKFARSVLRHIRVASKHELKERIMAGIDDGNLGKLIGPGVDDWMAIDSKEGFLVS